MRVGLLRGRALAVPAAAGRPRCARSSQRIDAGRGARARRQPAGHPRRAGARAGRARRRRSGYAARGARAGAPAQPGRRWRVLRPARRPAHRCCWSSRTCSTPGQSTIEALHALAGALGGSRTMVLLTERTAEDPGHRGAARRRGAPELGPLDARPTSRRWCGAPGWPTTRSGSRSWTGGYAAVPDRAAAAAHRPGRPDEPPAVPQPLQDAVAARIAHAGGTRALLLAQCAVLGASVRARRRGRARRAGRRGLRGARRARAPGRAARGPGRAGSASPTTSSARWPTTSVPEPVRVSRHRRAGPPASTAGPETAAGHLAAAGDADGAARAWMAAAMPRTWRSPTPRPSSCSTGRVRGARWRRSAARRGAAAPRRRSARELGRHDDARADHEAALALARELGDAELEARVAGAAGLDRVLRPGRDGRRRAGRTAPPSWPSRPPRRRARCPARPCCSAGSGTGTATTPVPARPTSEVLAAGTRRTRPSRSRWPTAAPCCSTRTASPRPRPCWPGRRCCAGAPGSSGRCCRPCSSPRSPAATPATSPARCARWTTRGG